MSIDLAATTVTVTLVLKSILTTRNVWIQTNVKPDSIHAATMDGAKMYRGISFVNARMAMNPTLMVIIVGISTNALAKIKKFVLRQVI